MYNRNGRDYLRINGEYVETSQNVKVPIDYAKKLHSKVVGNSLKVGDNIMQLYAVKSIDEKDIIIGCHSFPIKYLIEWGNKNLF